MSKEMMVFFEAKGLCRLIFQVTEKSPKRYRQSLVLKMHTLGVEVIEHLYLGNALSLEAHEHCLKREEHQRKVLSLLKIINFLAELALEQHCLLVKQYQQITTQTTVLRKLVYGWMKSDKQMGTR